jgi:hypothetical protein
VGGEGQEFFSKQTFGLFGGFDWKQRFLLQKFHPMATLRLTLVIILIGAGITKSTMRLFLGQIFITW